MHFYDANLFLMYDVPNFFHNHLPSMIIFFFRFSWNTCKHIVALPVVYSNGQSIQVWSIQILLCNSCTFSPPTSLFSFTQVQIQKYMHKMHKCHAILVPHSYRAPIKSDWIWQKNKKTPILITCTESWFLILYCISFSHAKMGQSFVQARNAQSNF